MTAGQCVSSRRRTGYGKAVVTGGTCRGIAAVGFFTGGSGSHGYRIAGHLSLGGIAAVHGNGGTQYGIGPDRHTIIYRISFSLSPAAGHYAGRLAPV